MFETGWYCLVELLLGVGLTFLTESLVFIDSARGFMFLDTMYFATSL